MCLLHTLSWGRFPLHFLTVAEAGEATGSVNLASGASLTSLSVVSSSLGRGDCLKLHSIILLPHKMWRPGPACGLTVPAIKKVREAL